MVGLGAVISFESEIVQHGSLFHISHRLPLSYTINDMFFAESRNHWNFGIQYI